MLRFLHIEKTAGSTLTRSFERYFGAHLIRDYPNKGGYKALWPFLKLTNGKRELGKDEIVDREGFAQAVAGAAVIAGHGNYERLSWLVPAEKTIVLFRDPVQRLVSHHAHNARVHKMKNVTMDSLIDFARDPNWRNFQSRAVKGLDLKRACVGTTECYSLSVSKINERFDLGLVAEQGNVNPNKPFAQPYSLDAATVEEIQTLNSDDMTLYERARQL